MACGWFAFPASISLEESDILSRVHGGITRRHICPSAIVLERSVEHARRHFFRERTT
jgi:hypothetical protein